MRVAVSQIYIDAGVNFPFSHLFQRWISEELTAVVRPSADFIRRYGEDFKIVFNLSAKAGIRDPEIRGPTVFKKTKDVEYTVFLPFDTIKQSRDVIASAVWYFLEGAVKVFESLGIDAAEVSKRAKSIIEHICSDPSMIKRSPSRS